MAWRWNNGWERKMIINKYRDFRDLGVGDEYILKLNIDGCTTL